MEQGFLTRDESIRIIQEMIGMARNKMNDTGFHFLWWGALVMIASLAQYFMIEKGLGENSYWVWVALPVLGVPVGLVYEYKRNKKEKTRTRFDKIYGSLWMGFGITVMVAIFVSITYRSNPTAFVLLLVGLATFVSASIYRFTPLLIGAILFWVAAVWCTQLNDQNQLLINAAAIFSGYMIPGLLLWKKYQKEKNV